MSSQKDIPWKRLTAEGAAIVVSILLAFSIDAWWDERNAEIAFQENLAALEQEIEQNLSDFDGVLNLLRGVQEDIDVVLRAISDPGQPELPVGFTNDLSKIFIVAGANITNYAFDVVVLPEHLRRIKNRDLQARIAKTNELIANVRLQHRQLATYYADETGPALADHFVLSDFNWYAGQSGPQPVQTAYSRLQREGMVFPVPESPFEFDAKFVRSRDFWNLLYHWRAGQLDYANSLVRARDAHQETLELLRTEME